MRAIAIVGLGLMSAIGHAAPEPRTFTVRPRVYRELTTAQELMGESSYERAEKIVRELLDDDVLNPHERALSWQTLGFLHSSRQRFKDAAQAFEACLKLDALPAAAHNDTLYNLGQTLAAAERYDDAARALGDWLVRVERPSPNAHFLMATVLSQTKDIHGALRHARAALVGVKAPAESHLSLAAALHFKLDQLGQTVAVLRRLVELYPKKRYWLQLSSAYSETGDGARALAVLELADQLGHVETHDEVTRLAALYVERDLPLLGARRLERAMSAGGVERTAQTQQQLVDYWLLARERERALTVLESMAERATSGEVSLRLAQLRAEAEDWAGALAAARRALEQGDLKHPGAAHVVVGIAAHSLGRPATARRAFEAALGHASAREQAEQWLQYLRDYRGR